MKQSGQILAAIILFSLGGNVFAETESPALQSAIAPLADGVAPVAAARLQAYLAQNPPAAERTVALAKLIEALARAGRPQEALALFARDGAGLTNNAEVIYWRAQAFAALGRWAESLPLYESAATELVSPHRADAIFGQAEAFRALGRKEDAIRVLSSLEKDPRWGTRATLGKARLVLERGDLSAADRLLRALKPQLMTERNQRRFLLGQLNLAQGHPERAIETLGVILKNPEGVPHSLLIATLFALADAHAQTHTPEGGDDALEEFIDHHPDDLALPEVFARLDQLYQMERKPSTNELEHWMRDPAQPRQALATWYFARSKLRSGDRESAIALLTRVRDSRVRLPSLGEADLELARLHLARQDWDAAITAAEAGREKNPLPAFQQEADWLIAEVWYRRGQLEKAAPLYEQLASEMPSHSGPALFNAALCRLRLDQPDEFAADFRRVANDPAQRAVEGELLLEQGAVQAAQRDPQARQTFEKFIHDFPQSPRLSEAWVALAELAFHEAKPDLATARQNLARAREAHPTPAALERADYLQIWIEDATPSAGEGAVIAAASQFLKDHGASVFAPEVRMKLAEAYYRRGDFANAQTQFELLGQSASPAEPSRGGQKPEIQLAEKALFFAARSAMSSMSQDALDHALSLLDQVVKLNGEMKWVARNEEAAIERRLGKNREALALYDEVLKNEVKPSERREALCGKADILYEMGAADAQNYKQAIQLYEQLATEPGVPAHWRNQAEFKKGKALEKLNDKQAALTTYYRVLEEGARPDLQHEFFWFYKAGFNAAHLLEEANDWKSAVAVYRKLAAVGGTRSDEAKARLTQLRLEHFLWEE
jgi:TolA-binding protein